MNKNYQPTRWTRADALKINQNDPTTTQPVISSTFPRMHNDVFVWDTMPLRTLDGTIVSVNGWSLIFTLTSVCQKNLKDAQGNYDAQRDWGQRHDRAYIAFWYAKDSKSWEYGGRVMAPGVSPTAVEWAGTPILKNNKGEIDLYYTCKGNEQVLVKVSGKVSITRKGPTLTGFNTVKELLKGDGKLYQSREQNDVNHNFRDPSPFRDPKDGKLYMLFEGNVAGKYGSHVITKADIGNVPKNTPAPNKAARTKVGCIGLAVAKDDNGDEWELLPPLLTAVGVNLELERPHFVFKDGKYYLFTISHIHTFANGLKGPDGVYGFVSNNLTGPYKPMNESGLVLGNPVSQPSQTYSHYVMPNGLVTSFIGYIPLKGSKKYEIGGTEAPTIRINIKGERTSVSETLDYGYIPPMKDIKLVLR